MNHLHRTGAACLVAALLTATASAQIATPPSFQYGGGTDSGWVRYDGDAREVISSFSVVATGVPWMRLQFADVRLSGSPNDESGSILRITSHLDGAVQELNAHHVLEWQRTSAYFNGDAVQVEIIAQPGTGPNRALLRAVTAGEVPAFPETQCGAVDDRVLSSDPRVARVMPIGCTGWLIDDCNRCMLTAGHCFNDSFDINTAQFNVPLSTSGGSYQHPPPQDQYAVDPISRQFESGGVGSDWSYFGTFDNSTTGLSAATAQGAVFELLSAAPNFDPSIQIRITGHGVDSTPQSHNGVQQTHVGPVASITSTTVRYQTDTQGGNSGSPVIWEQTGQAVGIHTHGGCGAGGGSNAGTNSGRLSLQNALANPQGVCATCGTATTYCQGKVNSNFCTPFMTATGAASASSTSVFQLRGNDVLANEFGFLLYTQNGRSNLSFHGGTLCVKSPLTRNLPPKNSGSGGAGFCPGILNTNFNKRIQSGADPTLSVGAQVNAQYIYRDPADPFGDGLTDGVEFVIAP